MDFNEETLNQILAGQGEAAEKTKSILSLYEENVNGIKLNRDDFKKEKETLKARLDEAVAKSAKDAEDLKTLQAQLEKNQPEELKKVYQTQKDDLEKTYKGAMQERDTSIKTLNEQLASAMQQVQSLKCREAFDKAASKYDIEPSGRDFILTTLIGANGANFTERDLGNGVQLYNKDGKSIDGSLRDFLDSDIGKKFLRNGNSGGGAAGGNTPNGSQKPMTLEELSKLSPAEQMAKATSQGFKLA